MTTTVTTVARLSCNHAVDATPDGPVTATTAVGDAIVCPKGKCAKDGKERTRRVKDIVTAEVDEAPAPELDDATRAAFDGIAAGVSPAIRATADDELARLRAAAGTVQEHVTRTPPAPVPEADTDDDGGYDTFAAQAEWKALAAWRKADEATRGDRPDTTNLDRMNAAHAAGNPRSGRKPATKKASKAANPRTPLAPGLRFYVGDRAMPDSQNKISSVAYQMSTRMKSGELKAALKAQGIDDVNAGPWSATINGQDISARMVTADDTPATD